MLKYVSLIDHLLAVVIRESFPIATLTAYGVYGLKKFSVTFELSSKADNRICLKN